MQAARVTQRLVAGLARRQAPALAKATLTTCARVGAHTATARAAASSPSLSGLGAVMTTRHFRASLARHDLPSHKKIAMPALSPTMTQGNIANWMKKEGDEISTGDVIAEIETDKAVMEFEASDDGFLAKILVAAGTKDVPVGQGLCIVVEEKGDVAAFASYTDSGDTPSKPAAAAAPAPSAPTTPAAPTPAPAPAAAPPAPAAAVPAAAVSSDGKGSPLAKKLAKELGLDLTGLKGSGPEGRVVETDIYSHAKSVLASGGGASASVGSAPSSLFQDTELTNMRKIIASRLLESKTTIPHYYLTQEVRIDALMELRTQLNSGAKDFKLSVNDFIVKATALASRAVPECNSSWQDPVIRRYQNVDVSVAVSTPSGLITPIVPAAEAKGLVEISRLIKDLAERAKSNKLKPHEYQGGTITVSNLGMFGISQFSAIINPPQACILAVGGAQKTMLVDNGEVVEGTTIRVTLSCDHRVVDGAVGAQWLKAFKDYLEKPHTMLL